jgi:hypothetical protein
MIQLTETRIENGAKTIETKEIDMRQYNNITNDDTLKWFRRLGGSETATRNYTSRGYNVTKLISTSPDKSIKVIREFNFID